MESPDMDAHPAHPDRKLFQPTGNQHCSFHDEIAVAVYDHYHSLPQKCKPLERVAAKREWVPLSAIVLARDWEEAKARPHSAAVVSIGTGMKCLPAKKVREANGNVLHDSHAEIIAIRAFNRFLIEECAKLVNGQTSEVIRVRRSPDISPLSPQAFTIQENITIHMFCTEAPCGDASMELIIAAQEDATPWEIPAATTEQPLTEQDLRGRGSFSELGIVRRKPARADAPLTKSKSCTDKLARYQYTSLLGSVASLLVSPENAYLNSLILPQSQYVEVAAERAFLRRLPDLSANIAATWMNKYRFQRFNVEPTKFAEFHWSRRSPEAQQAGSLVASNISAVWTPHFTETLINGVLQGRKVGDPRGASKISRRRMWEAAASLAAHLSTEEGHALVQAKTYRELKMTSFVLTARRTVKADVKGLALKGWIDNAEDDGFEMDDRTRSAVLAMQGTRGRILPEVQKENSPPNQNDQRTTMNEMGSPLVKQEVETYG